LGTACLSSNPVLFEHSGGHDSCTPEFLHKTTTYKHFSNNTFPSWYAGSLAISKQAAKKEQLRLVTEAEATCKAAQAQLRWALPGQTAAAAGGGGTAAEARAGLGAELKVLSDNFAGLRKLVENQEVSQHCIAYI